MCSGDEPGEEFSRCLLKRGENSLTRRCQSNVDGILRFAQDDSTEDSMIER